MTGSRAGRARIELLLAITMLVASVAPGVVDAELAANDPASMVATGEVALRVGAILILAYALFVVRVAHVKARFAAFSMLAVIAVGCTSQQSPSAAEPTESAVPPATEAASTALPATEAPSEAPTTVLEGTWATTPTTCKQQNAALTRAGVSAEDLELAGWDVATCMGMIHGSQMTLEFARDRLVIYQDGVVGWDGGFHVVDSDTFEAGDQGAEPITFEYMIDGDELTIDLVSDEPPGDTAEEERFGELVAATVIYETAPFTRQLSAALPYSLTLPEGWTEGSSADSYQSADGLMALTIGTGTPEPGQTVEDRVRINREDEFADCAADPTTDRDVTVGGEAGILWAFECDSFSGLAANTIHEGLGYRLTLQAPSSAAAELERLMAELLAGFAFAD